MHKLLVTKTNKRFLIKDIDKDVHTNFGLIKAEDIKKAKSGEIIKSNKDVEFTVFDAEFIDLYNKIKRGPQIIPRKDIGLIITEAGLNKESIIIETGSGSGGTGCFLAKICKKVYSYEIREDFYNITKKNVEYLGIKNMVLKNKDAKKGFSEKNVDAIILDLPDPWELMDSVKKSLKVGGFLVSYSPTIPQVMDFVNRLNDSFTHIKTSEIIEREWEVKDRKVRPKSQAIGHSGFLSFARRIM
ncbi:MAG: methyltransferase domain-containing protein [Nanoarchaeota archaeon]